MRGNVARVEPAACPPPHARLEWRRIAHQPTHARLPPGVWFRRGAERQQRGAGSGTGVAGSISAAANSTGPQALPLRLPATRGRCTIYALHSAVSAAPPGVITLAGKCDLCGKTPRTGHLISHSHIRTKRVFGPNIQRVRAIVDGTAVRIQVCTRCLRSGKVVRAV